jgi:regulatory Fis family protein
MTPIPPTELGDALDTAVAGMVGCGLTLSQALDAFRRAYIRKVLKDTRGNLSRAAKVVSLHRNTLKRRIEQNPELREWLREFKRQKQLQFYRPVKPFSAHDAGERRPA